MYMLSEQKHNRFLSLIQSRRAWRQTPLTLVCAKFCSSRFCICGNDTRKTTTYWD